MSAALRPAVAVLIFLTVAAPLLAQPETDRDKARRLTWEGATLYGLATLQQREDRLVTACRTLEQAVRLDPEAITPRAALIPLYTALGRPEDAVKTAAAVVAMDPAQGPAWLTLARMRRDLGRTEEAVTTLQKCLTHPAIEGQPHTRAAAAREMGHLLEPSVRTLPAAHAAYRLAVTLYESVPAASPADLGDAAEGLGRTAGRFGKADEAHAAFAQAREAFTKAGETARAARIDYFLAELAAKKEDWSRAIDLLTRYFYSRPRDAEAYALFALAHRRKAGPNAALAELQPLARALPDFVPLQVQLADAHRRSQQTSAAERLYREVVRKTPDVDAYRGLIILLYETNGAQAVLYLLDQAFQDAVPNGRIVTNPQAAEHARAIAEALRQERTVVKELLRLIVPERGGWGGRRGRGGREPPPRPFDQTMVLADLAEATRQLEFAEELLRNAVTDIGGGGFNRRGGRMGQVSQGTADAYLALFRVLQAAHKHDDVVALCEEGVERKDALTPYFHFFAAGSLMRLGRGEKALEQADLCIDTINDDGLRLSSRLMRLHALAFLGRFDEAEAYGRKLLAPDDERDRFAAPEDEVRIRTALASALSEGRRYDRAEAQLRAALDIAPDDATVHNNLGYQLAEQGVRLDEAERLIRRAIEMDRAEKRRKKSLLAAEEENAGYLDSLGWVLFRKGRISEARDLLKKAVALPDGAGDPIVWDHLGDAHARLGETTDARRAWETARQKFAVERRSQDDARGIEVRRKLERLKGQ